MKTIFRRLGLGLLLGAVLHTAAYAASEEKEIPLDHAPYRVNNLLALQNGARLFVNYCLGCHSAKYMRYESLRSIGLTDDQIAHNLMFGEAKIGDTMRVAMTAAQAEKWFGTEPPDLSIITKALASHRGSGADFLYTYLRTFYRDDSRPTGWNNLAFPGVNMPNPLWMLQGQRAARFAVGPDPSDPSVQLKTFVGYTQLTPGTQSPTEYDSTVADLVAYMQWMAEPDQLLRKRLGVIVLIFLGFFTFLTWKLKSEYWKDVT
ncbi:cytochrome c1 [Thiomonas sp.]|jgi:ubiquinol-cytochrome c reductase cytochrome c1 subunit|uniref:cytochrome c1 n=1 Tax=Thiomonas sp. TaxID=2047785 RepID=UPI00262226C2|nr:cytochrome c1 [Thiomonas sp.]